MASEEEEKLLEDFETSDEISSNAVSSVLEENHNVTESEASVYTRSGSQGFLPVEVSHHITVVVKRSNINNNYS